MLICSGYSFADRITVYAITDTSHRHRNFFSAELYN